MLCIDARMVTCSGIGTFLKNLIPHFSPRTTTLLVHKEDLHKEPWLNTYPTKICKAPIYSVHEQIELPRLIPTCRVFWSPHYNVPLLPIRAKKRLVTIHDAAHLAFKDSMSWKHNLYAQCLFRQALSRSDRVVTDSFFSQSELCKYLGVAQERIDVVYLGVDTQKFSTPAVNTNYALPSQFFFCIGNLKPHKNLKLIIEAYEQANIEIPVVIAGKLDGLRHSDPLIHKIQTTPHLREKILLVGEVLDAEVPYFYQKATALIFPSLYEGFGLPPLEAMAAGCPVIASSAASIPEICEEAALLIDPHNPRALIAAMREMATPRREHFKKLGRAHSARFSWNKTAACYTALINSLK